MLLFSGVCFHTQGERINTCVVLRLDTFRQLERHIYHAYTFRSAAACETVLSIQFFVTVLVQFKSSTRECYSLHKHCHHDFPALEFLESCICTEVPVLIQHTCPKTRLARSAQLDSCVTEFSKMAAL